MPPFYFKCSKAMIVVIDTQIRRTAPDYAGVMIRCHVSNQVSPESLWQEMKIQSDQFRQRYRIEDINKLGGIYEMRQLYKQLGKDPNRYRPSAEALCRRIINGKNLYRINALVDIINLVSVCTGFSIGGFDADKVVGSIGVGVGVSGELFEAIGRGLLNIEGLPVYRDQAGCIGTPTSDEERTKLTLETTNLLMIIHSAGGKEGLDDALRLSERLLRTYVSATGFEVDLF